MNITDGEKLILTILCEIHSHLKVENGVNSKLILGALSSGHLGALKDELPGIFDVSEKSEEVRKEVEDVLFMWYMLERDYAQLAPQEKARVRDEANISDSQVRFRGFDGNYECDHFTTARFVVRELGKFQEFKGRDLNSHAPSVDMYRRMLAAFDTKRFDNGRMVIEQIIEVLKARQAAR